MKNLICVLFLGIIFSNDIELKTSDGKLVILHEDGTWNYKVVEKINISTINVECKYSKNEIDDFSGDKKLWTKKIKIGKSSTKTNAKIQFKANQSKEKDVIFLSLNGIGDLGCMSQMRSTAKLKFSDGEMIELTHHGSTECSSGTPFISIIYSSSSEEGLDEYILSEEDFHKLKTLKIEMIRIQGSKYYTDVIIDEDKQDYLIKYITCVER